MRAIPLCLFLLIGIFASAAIFPWLLLAFICGLATERRAVATFRYFFNRLRTALIAFLLIGDIALLLIITVPFYILGFAEDLPCPRETISARLGRHALKGRGYAVILSVPVDLLFTLLGNESDHCKRSALAYTPYWKTT